MKGIRREIGPGRPEADARFDQAPRIELVATNSEVGIALVDPKDESRRLVAPLRTMADVRQFCDDLLSTAAEVWTH